MEDYEQELMDADQQLDQAYETALDAVETGGNLSTEVESRLDSMYDTVESELDEYQQSMAEAYVVLEDVDSAEELGEVTERLVDAGQSLVNAYHEATVLLNKAESAMVKGDDAFDSDITALRAGENPEGSRKLNEAVNLKESAFGTYDDVLGNMTAEVADVEAEYGLVSHIDVGLGQQEPEL